MGRSAASCFKIITCGSDSVDRDDLEAPENKSSSDKRGWSFRKRSARHRVLSNTVISETPSSANKESPETAVLDTIPNSDSACPEKVSPPQLTDDKPQLPNSLGSKLCEAMTATEDDSEADAPPEEAPDELVVVVIQTAIRGFLAQRQMMKQKNVIKLQAAVRGHLVRRHAVGTLRCVQAIIKMQALVRARRAQVPTEDKEISYTKPTGAYTSIEKLLSNSFARQLLESTPKADPINIKCDPSKADSAWKWLERWMSVSSVGNEGSHELGLDTEQVGIDSARDEFETADGNFGLPVPAMPSDSEENLITYDAESLELKEQKLDSDCYSHVEQTEPQTDGDSVDRSLHSDPDLINKPDTVSETKLEPFPIKSETENEPVLVSEEELSSGQPDEKKSSFGPRKASNPEFIAAQSKFEELSAPSFSTKSSNSIMQDIEAETKTELNSSEPDGRKKEVVLTEVGPPKVGDEVPENSVSQTAGAQVGGSECGTELSISSTLDSPDRSEVETHGFEHETKTVEDGVSNAKGSLDSEVEDQSTFNAGLLTYTNSVQPENTRNNNASEDHVDSTSVEVSTNLQQELEANATLAPMDSDSKRTHLIEKSSPESSPRSRVTVPESQGTPSSQISVQPKKSSSEKRGFNHKHKSFSAGKLSPSDPYHDSGTSSLEQLSKDPKSGKRRNSFGSARTDNGDQEPRDSSNSSSIPSYMQATESARAKAITNSSPRSSPDIQNKDSLGRKRHSLSGTNGRQGSPRIQRSLSQAQQNAKGNGANSPHERKWQR